MTEGLTLKVLPNESGQIAPFVDVTWTITRELADAIAEQYIDPHIVLVVSHITRSGDGTFLNFHYRTTAVYKRRLTDTPKQWVQFQKAGEHLVTAYIIDATSYNKRVISDAMHDPYYVYIPRTLTNEFERPEFAKLSEEVSNRFNDKVEQNKTEWADEYYNQLRTGDDNFHYMAETFAHVVVDKDLFAKEPAKWRLNLTHMFFRDGKGVDECDFRKRFWFGAVPLSIPVQLYGLFARLFTLLYALFMAKRGIQWKQLFALRPHDFGKSLKYSPSFWYKHANGDDRADREFIQWVAPPTLLVYAVVLSIAGLVVTLLGLVSTGIIFMIQGLDPKEATAGQIATSGLITAAVIALIIYLIWLNASWDGRYQRDAILSTIGGWFSRRTPASTAVVVDDAERISKLQRDLYAMADRGDAAVKNNTVYLVFNKVKSAVCMPFSK